MREQSIFIAALDISDPAERSAYIATACGGNEALRKEIEALLASHEKPGAFLDAPAVAQIADSGAGETRTIAPGGDPDFTETRAPDTPSSEDDVLPFLQPPTRPDSLGRLAHYEVLEVLGKGGFGTVLRAFDDRLHRVVAIKVMAPQLAASGAARARFVRESRAGAAVRDDHVVNVYHVSGDDEAMPYLVMEFVAGQTLQQKLDKVGPLSVAEVLRIGGQIARGLAAAHATGLIHRDIKPANILLENGVERVKITDFGLARAADDASISQSGVVAGTPMYMAPEQARGDSIDHRADLFSLGSVLYVMCTGRLPFRAETTLAVLKRVCEDDPRPVREVNPQIPQWLADVVVRLHAKNPADRFQTAKEVADLLAQYLTELQMHGTVTPQVIAPTRAKRRRRKAMWEAVIVLVAVGLVFGGVAVTPRGQRFLANEGVLEVVSEPHLVAVSFSRDGKPVSDRIGAQTAPSITVGAGRFKLEPEIAPGSEVERWELTTHGLFSSKTVISTDRAPELNLPRGSRMTIRVVMRDAPVAAPSEDGFVPLFNGKNLDGWKTLPDQPGDWRVEGGAIVGRGPGWSHLFTDRGDFENFHLRAEAKINAAGNSGVYFHAEYGANFDVSRFKGSGFVPVGYEVEVAATGAPGVTTPTGSVCRCGPDVNLSQSRVAAVTDELKPDTWVTIEVIARGDRRTIRVNGKTVVDYSEKNPFRRRGHFALQCLGQNTAVHFRKIEVKELPPSAPGGQWVQLFNGKNLDGLVLRPDDGSWKVENGVLVCTAPESKRIAVENDYRDVHFRVELQRSADGQGAVAARVTPGNGVGVGIGSYPDGRKSGSAYQMRDGKFDVVSRRLEEVIPAGVWCAVEIITQGGEVAALIDGKEVFRQTLPGLPESGAFGVSASGGTLRVRKMEVRELLPAEQWVSLFNGKNLDGWVTHPDDGGTWKVEEGAITGSGKESYLFTRANDFDDFHLRVVARINAAGDAGVLFRTGFAVVPLTDRVGVMIPEAQAGYEAQINLRPHFPTHTGSLALPSGALQNGPLNPHKPDEWFTLEVIAQGNHLKTFVDGKPIADYRDAQNRFRRGRIALQNWAWKAPITRVQFRSVEVRRLPPEAQKNPPPAVAPFDAPKAKEHQEQWAKYLGIEPEVTNSIGMTLRLIPPGEFTMGNSDENPFALPEDKPQHRVRLTKPYYIGTHEVTVGQFSEFVTSEKLKTFAETDPSGAQVADETGYHKVKGTNWRTPGFPQTNDHPVTCVTWAEATAFCEWLSKKEGVTYRLPTDAEWECACRGGTTTAYHYGPKADPKMAAMQRWADEKKTLPVGSFPANAFGLKDMLGNVYEWCYDGRRKYTTEEVTDPLGPVGPKDERVRRGGAWSSALDQKSGALSGGRFVGPLDTDAAHTIGFRIVRVGDLTPKAAPTAKEPDLAVLQPLRDAVAARGRALATVKLQFEAGKVNKLDLLAVQVEFREANVKLAEAEGDTPILILHLRELVKLREEERELIALRVQLGVGLLTELEAADARFSDAKARLAKVRPPDVAPPPRPKP